MKVKPDAFTREEKSWILYDWANSVYSTNMTAAIFPIYYATIAGDDGNKWWGDRRFRRLAAHCAACPSAWLNWRRAGNEKKDAGRLSSARRPFHRLHRLCAGLALDAARLYVVPHRLFGRQRFFMTPFSPMSPAARGWTRYLPGGYAMGYLGGSTIPFVLSVIALLITGFGEAAVKFSILLTSVWWALFSLPLLVHVRQTHYTEDPPSRLAADTGEKAESHPLPYSRQPGARLLPACLFLLHRRCKHRHIPGYQLRCNAGASDPPA